MANPVFKTLVADTEMVVTCDSNYAAVEVTLVSGAATTYFNVTGTTIGTVASPVDGNHVLNATLISKTVIDQTTGNTVVHLRSTGTPVVEVYGR